MHLRKTAARNAGIKRSVTDMRKDIERRLVRSAPWFFLGLGLSFLFAPGAASTVLILLCGILWMLYVFGVGAKKQDDSDL